MPYVESLLRLAVFCRIVVRYAPPFALRNALIIPTVFNRRHHQYPTQESEYGGTAVAISYQMRRLSARREPEHLRDGFLDSASRYIHLQLGRTPVGTKPSLPRGPSQPGERGQRRAELASGLAEVWFGSPLSLILSTTHPLPGARRYLGTFLTLPTAERTLAIPAFPPRIRLGEASRGRPGIVSGGLDSPFSPGCEAWQARALR